MESIKIKNIYNEDVEIIIVDSEKDANFITHSGTFHADEVMATVFLLNKFGTLKVFRTTDPKNNDALIYDVGFGKYDHHQGNFDLKRDNGIKYASCGLIWREFGLSIINKLNISNKEEFFLSIDKNLVMDIDRDDNGQSLIHEPITKMQNIPNLISYFNPAWNDSNNENKCFLEAVTFANTIFNNIVSKMLAKEEARSIVEQKIDESKNGILILDEYMPWKDIVLTSKKEKAKSILYAVFPSKRGGYNVVATPISNGSFMQRKPFDEAWGGKTKEELFKLTGIKTFNFCHKGLFICACDTLEDALKIANLSVSRK